MKPWCVAVLLAMLASSACVMDPSLPSARADSDPSIRTDAPVYALQYQPGIYTVRIRAEYTNRTGRTVYLHRHCGYGDRPHRHLVRADADVTPIWLNEGACISLPLRLPIPVRAGETYGDEFELVSTESPHAQPPITMGQRTGVFQLVYDVQRTNRVDGWGGVDLLPLEQRVSNAFRVEPPQ